MAMGYGRKEVDEALQNDSYNEIMATYLLLGRKTVDVGGGVVGGWCGGVVGDGVVGRCGWLWCGDMKGRCV